MSPIALEDGLLLILVALIIVGLVLPPFIGKPYFWFFRKNKKSAADELLEARAHREEAERHATASYIEAQAKKFEREAEDIEFGARLNSRPETVDPSKPSKPYSKKST